MLAPGGGRALVPTGIALAIPAGYAGFVQPRSGLALRHGVTCLNTPGLIDAGYRDELRVLLVNPDPTEPYEVHRGDRIAQLVLQQVEQVDVARRSTCCRRVRARHRAASARPAFARGTALADDVGGVLVDAAAEVARVAEHALGGPLAERDLDDDLGSHPVGLAG